VSRTFSQIDESGMGPNVAALIDFGDKHEYRTNK